MADTALNPLGILQIEVGASDNTWGDKLNENFDEISDKIGDVTAITGLNGGTDTLTQEQSNANAITLAGTLLSNQIIEFPYAGTWIVTNNCTGAFTTTLKVSGQTGIVIANGQKIVVFHNGTDIEAMVPEATAAQMRAQASQSAFVTAAALANRPAFYANRSDTDLSISTGTTGTIPWIGGSQSDGSLFDNSEWTPPPGPVLLNFNVWATLSGTTGAIRFDIMRSGTTIARISWAVSSGTTLRASLSIVDISTGAYAYSVRYSNETNGTVTMEGSDKLSTFSGGCL
jgi:hypothetical protein